MLPRPTGWRRDAAAVLAGAIAMSAFPPIDWWWAMPAGLAALFHLLSTSERPLVAFRLGWLFAIGHFTPGLAWISNALLLDVARYWWLLPFSLLGLPALLGIFVGAAMALCRWVAAPGWRAALAFAACWSVAELARGHMLTGFPWNLAAYGLWGRPELTQAMALVGAYGLGFLVALASAGLAVAVADRRRWPVALAALGTLVALGVHGDARLDATPAGADGPTLRLVQPAIAQSLKWDDARRLAQFEAHLSLSAASGLERVAAVIWPETATPFLVEREPFAREAIAKLLAPGRLAVIGTPRATPRPTGGHDIWNGMVVFDHAGSLVAAYDKFHLVPFGEYVPLADILPLDAIAGRMGGMTAGPGPRTLRVEGLPPFSPLICYEVIFPGRVLDPADRPRWLLNLTNDAWFGPSIGPHQHLAIARARAIEEGLPLVRVANNGISAVIDAHGRVRARLDLDQIGYLDAALPPPLSAPPPYARWGDIPLVSVILLILAWAAVTRPGRATRGG
jgi:apolipoprotein N-acyltransferase